MFCFSFSYHRHLHICRSKISGAKTILKPHFGQNASTIPTVHRGSSQSNDPTPDSSVVLNPPCFAARKLIRTRKREIGEKRHCTPEFPFLLVDEPAFIRYESNIINNDALSNRFAYTCIRFICNKFIFNNLNMKIKNKLK